MPRISRSKSVATDAADPAGQIPDIVAGLKQGPRQCWRAGLAESRAGTNWTLNRSLDPEVIRPAFAANAFSRTKPCSAENCVRSGHRYCNQ
jgi:hypothetical protein